jgi:hypothetical protein
MSCVLSRIISHSLLLYLAPTNFLIKTMSIKLMSITRGMQPVPIKGLCLWPILHGQTYKYSLALFLDCGVHTLIAS